MGVDNITIVVLALSNISFILLFMLSQKGLREMHSLNARLMILAESYKKESDIYQAALMRCRAGKEKRNDKAI